jgi:hypothetical protein
MPLEIVKIKLPGKELKLNERFEAEGDDWFKGLAMTVKNVSEKDIQHFYFLLVFPETGLTGPTALSTPIRFGQPPSSGRDTTSTVLLKPGEETELRFADDHHAATKKTIQKSHTVRELTIAEFNLQGVDFSDHTMWYSGEIYMLNPNGSGEWIRIDK